MSTTHTDKKASLDRLQRAVHEPLVADDTGQDLYHVANREKDTDYVVDLHTMTCTCPDFEHNLDEDEHCKHLKRVLIETGQYNFGDARGALRDRADEHDARASEHEQAAQDLRETIEALDELADDENEILVADGCGMVADRDDDVDPKRDLTTDDWHQDAFDCTIMGVDGYGYLHVYDDDRDRVVVLDETGIDETQDLSDHRTGQWMDWVEEKRGWERQDLFDLMWNVGKDIKDELDDGRRIR
jgi:hypothetical protein